MNPRKTLDRLMRAFEKDELDEAIACLHALDAFVLEGGTPPDPTLGELLVVREVHRIRQEVN